MSTNPRFASHRLKSVCDGKRSHSPSPLGKIAVIASKDIKSLSVAPKRSFSDTGTPCGLGTSDADGNVYLTVATHGEDLFAADKAYFIRNGEGYIRGADGTKITKLKLSSPLLSIGKIKDTVDLIEGKVYRAIGSLALGENTEIKEVYYCGFRCYAIDMPEGAQDICYIGRLRNVLLDELSDLGEGIIISRDRRTAYVHLGNEATVYDLRDFLRGSYLIYPLLRVREEQLAENLKDFFDEGVRYMEICANTDPVFLITYKKGASNVRKNK